MRVNLPRLQRHQVDDDVDDADLQVSPVRL
jgi:hypothetical protein